MALITLTKENFDEETKTGVSLIDFWAPWCGPCRALTPVLEELDKDVGDQITVGKVNVDEESDLSSKFEIRSIPAIYIMKDGEVVDQFVGVKTQQELKVAVEKALAN